MNIAVLIGRLTAKPELSKTKNGDSYTRFTLAVDRDNVDSNGNRETDFFDCIAWRKTAELISKYFTKGNRIGIEGAMHTRTYKTQDGSNRKNYEVSVSKFHFCESKGSAQTEMREVSVEEDDFPF